ncbi:MAG: alpha-mannosidase [Armatimonadetes bacterium]|nr:alpha-mannosidase [Armatimonadota bacterium]
MKFRFLSSALAITFSAFVMAQQKPTLYVVPYAHLDTQWRWSYPQVIREYLWNTMEDNFKLFDKYPHYTFNFGGSRRFEMMKEYFPEEYKKVVAAVKAGRWFPAPASVDETEVNIISGESVIRNVLYGNEYYKKEFGVTSDEFMRPDSFGFPYSLPTLLSHAGIKGFSTQKLTWGSTVGIPFNVGVWVGPDGSGVVSALNPTSYGSRVTDDLSNDPEWIKRLSEDPIPVDYRYYGTGDRGGAPAESSVANGEKSVTSDGPIKVIQAGADVMFKTLTPEQIAKLPRYQGELLLTQHSAGSMSSHSEMKRWNRKNELLADVAERASVAASLWAQTPYPMAKLNKAWDLTLGSQMHDMLPGTCLPKAYEYAQNDENIAQNSFASTVTTAVGAVASRLNTSAKGTALVVQNPLSIARQDVVEAEVPLTGSITVYGPDGRAVPTQVKSTDGQTSHILFLANVPANGFEVYDARHGQSSRFDSVRATKSTLENGYFRVTLNAAGDIASIYDKRAKHEAFKSPSQLDFQHENPAEWPAWNMDWDDQNKPPYAHLSGPVTMKLVEHGPVRSTIEVTRETGGSKFVQRISLASGQAGDHVEVENLIDWSTRETALKAAFHLTSPNSKATFGMQVGAIVRENNNPKKYELPVHGWMDVTSPDGKHGVGILSPFKYGSDKPSDDTIRLTLIYTPGTRGGYEDQGVQDFGRHSIVYGIVPHAGDWRQANMPWESARLAQPLRAFVTSKHEGSLGKSKSLASTSSNQVEIQAIKQAEDRDGYIVRLRELTGRPASNVVVTMSNAVVGAEAVDGQERPLGSAETRNGKLIANVKGFGLASFRVRLATPKIMLPQPSSSPVALPFDLDVVSTSQNDKDGDFDHHGRTLAAEEFPSQLKVDNIEFKLGPTTDGAKNALSATGQTIRIPKGYQRLYLLAAGTSDTQTSMTIGSHRVNFKVPSWAGYIGQWDTRLWKGEQPELAYGWRLPFDGLAPGYVKQTELAWYTSHCHLAGEGNGYYQYTYLFNHGFDIPKGVTSVRLPVDPNLRIFAISVAKQTEDQTSPAMPLIDTLDDHKPGGMPSIVVPSGASSEGVDVTLTPPLYWKGDNLRYTTDGSKPTAKSLRYTGPIFVGRPTTIKVAQINDNGTSGPVAEKRVEARDSVPPKLVTGTIIRSLGFVSMAFSEPINRSEGESVSSYQISGAKIVAAKLSDDSRSVFLTLDRALADDARVTVSTKVHDRVGNSSTIEFNAGAEMKPVFDLLEPVQSKTQTFDAPVPRKGTDSWTLNFWVKVDKQPEPRTVLAGFGRARDGQSGTGRYIASFPRGLEFWAANQDVTSNVRLDLNRWQMLTATFDGTMLRLYKDGQKIGEGTPHLSDDNGRVNVMPIDPWQQRRTLDGEIKDFTIWPVALPAEAIEKLQSRTSG